MLTIKGGGGCFALGMFFQLRLCVWRGFPRRGVGRSFCILGGVISEQSIVLLFFVAFELVLGR